MKGRLDQPEQADYSNCTGINMHISISMRGVPVCTDFKCMWSCASRTSGRAQLWGSVEEPPATAGREGSDKLGLQREGRLGGLGDLSEKACLKTP